MRDLLTVEQRNTRRLAKIHKLKRENRTLSSRRKELIKATALDSKIWLKTVAECIITGREFKGIRWSFDNNTIKRQTQLNKISEQIGKNSAKIQRLRTLIGQDKAWENRPEFYKFYEAGQQSRQADVDVLQKRIDDALEKCCTGIRKQGGDYYLELIEGILKGNTK